ncbi:Phosphoglycerate kinase, partial [Frankliniella fusca]
MRMGQRQPSRRQKTALLCYQDANPQLKLACAKLFIKWCFNKVPLSESCSKMDPEDNKQTRLSKRARRRYLEADEDEEESRDVDLSNLSVAACSSNFTLEPVDFRTPLSLGQTIGLAPAGSGSRVDSTSSILQTSSLVSHAQVPDVAALLPVLETETGATPAHPAPLPLRQPCDFGEMEDTLPITAEIGEFLMDCVAPEFNNVECDFETFSRFAVEDVDVDMLEEEPAPTLTDEKKPLYEGAPITSVDSLTAIMSFIQSEHISGAGLGRLLSLISLHLPTPNNFFTSSRGLFKSLEDHEEPVDLSYFCSSCLQQLRSSTDLCENVICTDENKSICMFIHLPLIPQVQRMCNRPNFARDVEYRFNRVKENNSNLEDIYDGKAYKAAEQQFRAGETNLTLTWNTDGLQVFNSSLMSLWPFYFVINELPPNKRFLTENMLIGGIWCGVTKPHPNLSLKHIFQDLKVLQNGISINENSVSKVYVKLICGTCDAPAIAYFLNMKTHSGFYSCHLCLCYGENSKDTGDVTVLPFEEHFAPRTLEQYHNNVKFAVENRVLHNKMLQNDERCCGIKGPCLLSFMVDNLFLSTAIDSMHCVYLGVMRQMLNLWFDKVYKEEPFSIHSKIKTVNGRIKNIEPPHFLERMPETIDKLVHWKASMFRAFLFNFSLPVLFGVLCTEYFENLILFVTGVSLLNSSSVSPEDIQIASLVLSSFVENFQTLYGKRHMSHNLHMLLHLSENVEYLAPLWVTNCFKYEDMNGRLLQLVHGTRHAGLQIHANLSMVTHLPLMVHNLENGNVKQYCQRLRYKWMQFKISSRIADNQFCIGAVKPLSPTDYWMLTEISQVTLHPTANNIQVFERLYKDGILYVYENYKKTHRVSSYVKYDCHSSKELGNIVTFVKITETSSDYYAVLKRLQSSHPFSSGLGPVRHLHEIHSPHVCIDVVPVSSLKTVLFK